jgi:hypothetical protein
VNEKGKDKGEEKKYENEIRVMEEKKKDVNEIRKTKKKPKKHVNEIET